ncbi:discoidin domain-containing protein [Lysinibacillus sp. NPDC086135]|uniref:discoidin domain-containing protein n=1 Tax=Lysinibacillus sp. NPDC086135 TaxID=3364130 RepID=UPI0038148F15
MNWYLKIEGSGGGTSGSGILYIEVYDQKGNLVKLTKSDVVETNCNTRNADDNYVHMFQTRGSLPPYNGIASGIFYTIKLPDYVEGFEKVFVKNWTNTSYEVRDIKVSVSKNNIEYEKIFDDTFSMAEGKTILQNYSLGTHRLLLQSNSKIYSIESIDTTYETKMTSNTTPSPYQITSSGDFNSSYAPWKAFDGKNTEYTDSWITTSGSPLGWIQINFGTRKRCNKLSLTTRNYSDSNATAPKEFKISCSNDGLLWNELAQIQNQTGWKQNETRIFEFTNERAYQYYRVQITVANSAYYSAIGELVFGYKGVSLVTLPNKSVRNFYSYGKRDFEGLNKPINKVDHVLQDIEPNTIITKKISKKLLSISFK